MKSRRGINGFYLSLMGLSFLMSPTIANASKPVEKLAIDSVVTDTNQVRTFETCTTNSACESQKLSPSCDSDAAWKKGSCIAQAITATQAIQILTPTSETVADVPATTVVVQFPTGSKVELRVNGELVNSSNIGRTVTDANTKLVNQTWYGVPLKEGVNTISAGVVGATEAPTTVKVSVRGAPKKLTLETVESHIPADGHSTATIKGQLLDENGNLSNRDGVVTLVATAGEFVGKNLKPDQPGFHVRAKKGQFTATLQSNLHAQTVRIHGVSGDLEAYAQIDFKTALRPSLVTGVVDVRLGARGTNYYGSLQNFLPPDKNNQTNLDFHSAIFATGKVGDWLFTGAYNSDGPINPNCNCTSNNRLFGTYQFNDQNYPVYGDSSKVDATTPSIDSVYVRFERSSPVKGANPDFAMWGDYHTEEFARPSQQFTAITRELHGFKANYNLGNLDITAFYGNNVEGFQRDTMAPDGTSGYYFLSRRLLTAGSENVSMELEELNRPGTVVASQQLNRGADYDIDYNRGTLLFHQPVLATDIDQNGNVLVRRIVVTYQYQGSGTSSIYAGRLQYNLSRKLNQESWIGTTYFKEDQGIRNFELYGADAQFALGSQGKLIAEYAHSTNQSDVLGLVSGEAWRIEAAGKIFPGVQANAYYRFADTGFANDATISFVPGQTRYGAQIISKVSPTTNLRFQYDHEADFGIAPQPLTTFADLFTPSQNAVPGTPVNNSLTTISAGVDQHFGKADLATDWIHRDRQDYITPTLNSNSDQLRSRLTYPLTNNLTFLAQNELTLSSKADAVYPDRSILGLNWAAIPGINIGLGQQFYTRGQYNGNSITNLSINGEHKIDGGTTLTGRYEILGGANAITTQGAIGLNNRWALAPGLLLNTSYEHIFGSFFANTAAGQQFSQPFAPGQSASSIGFGGGDSYSIGLEYTRNPDFKASARYEHRTSSGGTNTVITAGASGKISPALTGLVRYQQANASNQNLIGLADTADFKVGLAYRDPNSDKFNALFSYQYRKNPGTIPDTILLGTGTGSKDSTFAVEAVYAPNWQWEFYGKYAIRNSTSYLASDLVGTSIVNLAQLRATYRLGYKWDLAGEARWIGQSNYLETGFLAEIGYYLSPNLRIGAGYAFGKVDDQGFSGTRSAGGLYVGVTLKVNELFDGFGLQKPLSRPLQDSSVQTDNQLKK